MAQHPSSHVGYCILCLRCISLCLQGNSLMPPKGPGLYGNSGFMSLTGRHKDLLNNVAPFPGQPKGPGLKTSPNKPQLSNDNGNSRLATPAGPASKPRNLWKKSVETLKTQPAATSPGAGPGSVSGPRSSPGAGPAPGPGPAPMKSQRYLPEDGIHSDMSECSSRPPSHKDSDGMATRGGFKPPNQLRKRGGGGGGGGGGGQAKIYSIDSDQASLHSAPMYQRESQQGGSDDHGYPPDLFSPDSTHSHQMEAPMLQLNAGLLHHSHSAEADLHSLKDKKYSTYKHIR